MGLISFLFRLVVVLFIFRLAGIVARAFFWGFRQGVRPSPEPGDFTRGPVDATPRGRIEDLVKDPVCGVHVVRSSATEGRYLGATAYFCSPECAARADAGAA